MRIDGCLAGCDEEARDGGEDEGEVLEEPPRVLNVDEMPL